MRKREKLVLQRSFTAKQLEFLAAVDDPAADEILFDGSIRAGKTQACCWQVLKWALKHGGTYLIARNTYPELRDSTRKVFVEGDGGMPPTCPPELVEDFNKTDNVVRIRRPNGGEAAEVIFRAIGDDGLGRIKNISLAGAFIDQIEELDAGRDGEAMYDEILGRLSDPRGPRKLIAAANPGSTLHWAYLRLVKPGTRGPNTRHVHCELTDNAECLPADYLARMLAKKETRPHWYKSRILGLWGSFEGAAYTEFDPSVHVVSSFAPPQDWASRFEQMDHGLTNPSAWHLVLAEPDGALVVAGEYYSPGLIPEHAAAIKKLRADGWERRDDDGWPERHPCIGDPSIRNKIGTETKLGDPASILTEYAEQGIGISPGNNDRKAGHSRIRWLLHPDPDRIFPPFHARYGERGAPRLFFMDDCPNLIEQVQNAPIQPDGKDAGEIVDPSWETQHGHAHAALRYGAMSRVPASKEDEESEEDTPEVRRARYMAGRLQRNREDPLKREIDYLMSL